MIGDYINLSDHSTAQLVARAVERAEADAHSCVVRHAQVEQTHRTFWARVEAKRQAGQTVRPFAVRKT
jgi:hypothetical protein